MGRGPQPPVSLVPWPPYTLGRAQSSACGSGLPRHPLSWWHRHASVPPWQSRGVGEAERDREGTEGQTDRQRQERGGDGWEEIRVSAWQEGLAPLGPLQRRPRRATERHSPRASPGTMGPQCRANGPWAAGGRSPRPLSGGKTTPTSARSRPRGWGCSGRSRGTRASSPHPPPNSPGGPCTTARLHPKAPWVPPCHRGPQN